MVQAQKKALLFLGTGNFYRSRVAELLFNDIASKFGLAWEATSRSAAPEQMENNLQSGASVLLMLKQRAINGTDTLPQLLPAVTDADLLKAERVIVLQETRRLNFLQNYPTTVLSKVEYWQIDIPDELLWIEHQVNHLIARLLGGGKQPTASPAEVTSEPAQRPQVKPAKVHTVKVGRETAGRRGKGVTIVSDLPLDEGGLHQLATALKQRCGTGGTVKDGRIEIQGDLRDRLCTELEKMGYHVKRVGG